MTKRTATSRCSPSVCLRGRVAVSLSACIIVWLRAFVCVSCGCVFGMCGCLVACVWVGLFLSRAFAL